MVAALAIRNQRLEAVDGVTFKGDGRDYGSYRSGPPRIVDHTTETPGLPGYNGGASAPHVTYLAKERRFVQHLPFDRSAGAMRNAAGGVETNADSALQIEIVCYSDHTLAAKVTGSLRSDQLTDANYSDLAALHAGLGQTYSVPMIAYPQKITDGRCYGASSPCRMTAGEWDRRQLLDGSPWGICGHRNVPENTHWDPGSIDLTRIATEAYRILVPSAPLEPALPAGRFDDVPANHWSHDDVEYLAALGIVKGEGPRRFDPDGQITRAEAATLIARSHRILEGGTP